ncbi:MAG: U32 family peptidase, partial [Actinomycetia bacterium]|nr:U32 family peptidase [Actinomycetes bacterium]
KRDLIDRRLFLRIKEIIEKAGKRPILSTPVFLADEDGIKRTARLIKQCEEVEINSLSFLVYIKKYFPGKKITLGPFFPVCNQKDLEFVESLDDFEVNHIVFRPDLSEKEVKCLIEEFNKGSYEVNIYGHFPISVTWNCLTARLMKKDKNTCNFICSEAREIMLENLSRDQSFLINGPCILSGKIFLDLKNIELYRELGIEHYRIYPLLGVTRKVIKIIEDVFKGKISAKKAKRSLYSLSERKIRTKQLVGK